MKSGSIISVVLVTVIAFVLLFLYQQGRFHLPGLPVIIPVQIKPTDLNQQARAKISEVSKMPLGTAAEALNFSSDPVLVMDETRAIIFSNLRRKQFSLAIANADAWLVSHKSDGLIALLRQNAVSSLIARARPVITIGLSAPLSGSLKQVGEAFVQGLNMAVAEVNANNGIRGQRVLVDIVNDGGQRAQAIDAASRLLASKAVGVVGPYSSSTTLASAEIYNQGLPMIAPAATNPKISQAGVFIYRVAPSDTQQGASLARLVKSRQHKQVAVLFDPNDAYSKGLAEAFQVQAVKIGLSAIPIEFELNQYNTPRVGNMAFDSIFVAGYTADVAAVARLEVLQPREIFAGDGAYGQDLLQKGTRFVEGVVMTSFWHATLTDTASVTFRRSFEARYGGGTPNANALQAYDATRTLLEAIRRAQPKVSRKNVQAALQAFRQKPGAGVTAKVQFDTNGDVIGRPWVAIQVKKGQFQAIGFAP